MSKLICVDCETDGPFMPDYSIVCFAAIVVEPSLAKSFYGNIKPISDKRFNILFEQGRKAAAKRQNRESPYQMVENEIPWLVGYDRYEKQLPTEYY